MKVFFVVAVFFETEFSFVVAPCFQLADGVLVVVDCVEGVSCPCGLRLEGALRERVKPVLFLNKIDRYNLTPTTYSRVLLWLNNGKLIGFSSNSNWEKKKFIRALFASLNKST